MKQKRFFIVILIVISTGVKCFSQEGQYINPVWMTGITTVLNNQDRTNKQYVGNLDYLTTIKNSFGIRYAYNTTNYFGFESGLYLTNQGQKYSGFLHIDGNTGNVVDYDFSSEINFKYISVPAMIVFNSELEGEDVFMSLSFGFTCNTLLSASMSANPAPVIADSLKIDLRDLYNKIGLAFNSNTLFNVAINEKWFLNFGFNLTQTINSIENTDKGIKLLDKDAHPMEYFYPVSVKKEYVPEYFTSNTRSAYSTKITGYSLLLGISYKIK